MPKLPDATALGQRPTPRLVSGSARAPGGFSELTRAVSRQGEIASERGGNLVQLGQSLTRTSETLEKMQEAKDELNLATARSRLTADLVDAENSFNGDEDYATYEKRFDERKAKTIAEVSKSLSPRMRQRFEVESLDNIAVARANIQNKARAMWRDMSEAQLDGLIDGNMTTYLSASDTPTRLSILDQTRKAIRAAEAQGIISHIEAGKRERELASSVSSAQYAILPPDARIAALKNGMSVGDDGQPIFKKTGTPLDFIPIPERVKMYRQAIDESLALRREYRIEQERRERLAEKQLDREGAATLKETYDLMKTGAPLTAEHLELLRKHPGVSPSQYLGVLSSSTGGATEDDANTLADLAPQLHSTDLSDELTTAFRSGKLTRDRYISMMNTNATAIADDRPDPPYKRARSTLSTQLDPGQMGSESTIRQALAVAQGQALLDFDSWFEMNPEATVEEAVKQANDIYIRYGNIDFNQISLSLPKPFGFTGQKSQITMDVIQAAEDELSELITTGKISEWQAKREADALKDWTFILQKKIELENLMKQSGKNK